MNTATQFDTDAITSSLNDHLEFFDLIVSKVAFKKTYLMIMIEAADVPDQEKSIKLLRENLTSLDLYSIEKIKVYGKKQENTLPDWEQEFLLESLLLESLAIQPINSQYFWQDSSTQKTTKFSDNFKKVAIETTNLVVSNVSQTADSIAQSSVWDSLTQKAIEVSENVSKVAVKTTNSVRENVSQTINSDAEISENVNIKEPLDLAKVPESDRLAFYGALFAIASADGTIEKEEMELIFSIMDLEGMSEEGKRQCLSFIIEPPPLQICLEKLSKADVRLHFGLMVNLIDVAWVNHEFDTNELKAIKLTQQMFSITNEQVIAIAKFVKKVQEIREQGLDDNNAADAIKTAASGLSAVGVPLAAVWFSGSVIGFSAAGITSGLAGIGALVGLGGMVPGIGVAILLGTGIFMGVNALLDTGDKQKKAQFQAERERKAQLVIKNLQHSLNMVIERITNLEDKASNAEANKQAILILTDKMRKLQQLLNKRQKERPAT